MFGSLDSRQFFLSAGINSTLCLFNTTPNLLWIFINHIVITQVVIHYEEREEPSNCISHTVALGQVPWALPWGFTLLDCKRGNCNRNATTQWLQFISHNSPARSGQQGSSTPWCHLETLVSSARLLCCLLRCHPHLHRWEWQQLTSRWAEEKKSQSVKMLFVSKSEMICT